MKVNEAFTSLLNNIYQIKKENDKSKLFLNNSNHIELQKNQNKNNDSFCC